jgi:hypothetical protein
MVSTNITSDPILDVPNPTPDAPAPEEEWHLSQGQDDDE